MVVYRPFLKQGVQGFPKTNKIREFVNYQSGCSLFVFLFTNFVKFHYHCAYLIDLNYIQNPKETVDIWWVNLKAILNASLFL